MSLERIINNRQKLNDSDDESNTYADAPISRSSRTGSQASQRSTNSYNSYNSYSSYNSYASRRSMNHSSSDDEEVQDPFSVTTQAPTQAQARLTQSGKISQPPQQKFSTNTSRKRNTGQNINTNSNYIPDDDSEDKSEPDEYISEYISPKKSTKSAMSTNSMTSSMKSSSRRSGRSESRPESKPSSRSSSKFIPPPPAEEDADTDTDTETFEQTSKQNASLRQNQTQNHIQNQPLDQSDDDEETQAIFKQVIEDFMASEERIAAFKDELEESCHYNFECASGAQFASRRFVSSFFANVYPKELKPIPEAQKTDFLKELGSAIQRYAPRSTATKKDVSSKQNAANKTIRDLTIDPSINVPSFVVGDHNINVKPGSSVDYYTIETNPPEDGQLNYFCRITPNNGNTRRSWAARTREYVEECFGVQDDTPFVTSPREARTIQELGKLYSRMLFSWQVHFSEWNALGEYTIRGAKTQELKRVVKTIEKDPSGKKSTVTTYEDPEESENISLCFNTIVATHDAIMNTPGGKDVVLPPLRYLSSSIVSTPFIILDSDLKKSIGGKLNLPYYDKKLGIKVGVNLCADIQLPNERPVYVSEYGMLFEAVREFIASRSFGRLMNSIYTHRKVPRAMLDATLRRKLWVEAQNNMSLLQGELEGEKRAAIESNDGAEVTQIDHFLDVVDAWLNVLGSIYAFAVVMEGVEGSVMFNKALMAVASDPFSVYLFTTCMYPISWIFLPTCICIGGFDGSIRGAKKAPALMRVMDEMFEPILSSAQMLEECRWVETLIKPELRGKDNDVPKAFNVLKQMNGLYEDHSNKPKRGRIPKKSMEKVVESMVPMVVPLDEEMN